MMIDNNVPTIIGFKMPYTNKDNGGTSQGGGDTDSSGDNVNF